MIAFFPEPYEDELAYSLFARFYMKSGYTTLRDVMDELYVNKWYRADTLFINKLKPDVVSIITCNISFKEFIEKHTMFPFYARFIKRERREKALQSMISMDGNYHNLLPISKGVTDKYLKYCPICAKEDREAKGETYWHRIHQIEGVNVCPIHKCILHNSSVPVGVKSSASLISAEQEVPEQCKIIYSNNKVENALVAYIAEVFQSNINYNSDDIGSFLRSRLPDKYLSNTRVSVKVDELYNGITSFLGIYQDSDYLQRVQKIYNGYRWNCYEICQLSLFQGISVKELVNYTSSKNILLDVTYKRLADKYGISYKIVADIGAEIVKDYDNTFARRKGGVQQKCWNDLDADYLPKVRAIINESLNNHDERPVKINAYYVSKKLGITSKQMDKLIHCKSEIEIYAEVQEHYWAREIVWAVNKVDASGIELCWRRIRELINIRKVNLVAALPYIKEIADDSMFERIKQLQ